MKKKKNKCVRFFISTIYFNCAHLVHNVVDSFMHACAIKIFQQQKKNPHVSYSCLANRRYVLLAEGLTRAAAQVPCVLCAVCFYHLSFYCILHSHSTPRTTCNQTISCRRPTDAWLLLYHHREQSKCSV